MVSPSLEKTGTLGREHPGAVGLARAPESIWIAWLARDQAIAVYFALTACVVHFLFNGGDGYFFGELYYPACGQHLAWGDFDQAPPIAVISRVFLILFGGFLPPVPFFFCF